MSTMGSAFFSAVVQGGTIGERSKTDPDEKRGFRRWLLALAMNQNLRFSHAFAKIAMSTLNLIDKIIEN